MRESGVFSAQERDLRILKKKKGDCKQICNNRVEHALKINANRQATIVALFYRTGRSSPTGEMTRALNYNSKRAEFKRSECFSSSSPYEFYEGSKSFS